MKLQAVGACLVAAVVLSVLGIFLKGLAPLAFPFFFAGLAFAQLGWQGGLTQLVVLSILTVAFWFGVLVVVTAFVSKMRGHRSHA